MLEFSILLLALACLAALVNWQNGLYIAIVTAFFQDPLRKLTEGEPAFFNLFVGLVFGCAIVNSVVSRGSFNPTPIVGWRRYLNLPFQIFVLILLLQAVHSFARFGDPLIPALGLINYLAPFMALGIAYSFAAIGGVNRVRSFFRLYLVFAVAALSTVYLDHVGFDWQILGEVGVGIRFYDVDSILTAYSGIFRASEIAAWHAATAVCVIILLFSLRKPHLVGLVATLLIVAVLVSLGILTGRRKLLVVIAIFVCAYVALVALFQRKSRGPVFFASIVGVLAFLGSAFGFDAEPNEVVDRSFEYTLYVARTSTVFSAVPERFVNLGLAPIMWAYDRFGLLGGGLGIGTQGVQHLASFKGHMGAAEGGLGKIMVELGLPGVLIVLGLGVALIRHIRGILTYLSTRSVFLTRLGCGLVAFLIANFASFSVATQAYGDIFILLFLGSVLGALLALPVMARNGPALRASRPPLSHYSASTSRMGVRRTIQ